jgi:3-isopropylmalate/(R)-2-methylmalate dehydratase large subunit
MAFIESLLRKKAGEEITLEPDFCVITDGPGHDVFSLVNVNEIKQKEKVIIILDHDIPAGSFDSAKIQKELIEKSQEGNLNFVQSKGIGYQVMIDEYVKAGNIVVSCGEHNSVYGAVGAMGLDLSLEELAAVLKTNKLILKVPETITVYLTGSLQTNVTCKDFMLQLIGEVGETGFSGKAVDFCGPALKSLNLTERVTLCALAGRTGAVTAFINEQAADSTGERQEYCLDTVKPSVAFPGDLNTVKAIDEIGKVRLAACFIGGCTGGSLEDMRSSAAVLNGKRVDTDTRLTIAPATNEVYLAAIEEGLIEIFIDCGGQILNPGCASCVTTSKGVVGDGEVMLSASCYNFPGCSGTKESKVFVANAKTVAASALTGYITPGK